MSDEIDKKASSEELISVPSFLSSDYGVSTAAACEYWLCSGCEAEMDDPCGSGEWCSECSCQGWECSESCSESCNESCSESCNESCTSMCAGEAGDACGECSSQSGCMGQGSSCSQSCSECSACEDCMDCENSCQNSVQSQIDQWDWFTNSETKKAYYAITGNGLVSDFSRNVWNDLVGRVRDVKRLANIDPDWDSGYATYYNTVMSAVDTTLTATRFNSLLANINDLKQTNIGARSKGDVVYGHYFITLTTALNNYISKM